MRRTAVIAIFLLVSGCRNGPADRAPDPVAPERGKPTMTDVDPSSPESWKQARALAATAARGTLEKRSDALPFMFMADAPMAVLVHGGRVVTERGAKVAGAYLRDLGVIAGTGPKIDDVLFVLAALEAWPPVKEVPKEAYIHAPDNPAMADHTARIEHDGVTARVSLTYPLGEPTRPGGGARPGDTVGGVDPDFKPAMTRDVLQCTLTIPQTGDPGWKVERVTLAE